MTRPRVILGPSGAYWVRSETRGSLPLLAAPWAAELLVATLAYFRHALGFRLYAYAVLPKGLEAVIQPPASRIGEERQPQITADEHRFRKLGNLCSSVFIRGESPTISKIMMKVKGSFAFWFNRRLGRRGSVWEKRFGDRPLLSAEEIRAAVLEVHSRPVALGLTERPEAFGYSGLTAGRNPVRVVDHLPVLRGGVPVPCVSNAALRAAS